MIVLQKKGDRFIFYLVLSDERLKVSVILKKRIILMSTVKLVEYEEANALG